MPNPFSSQTQLEQNGHYTNGQSLSDKSSPPPSVLRPPSLKSPPSSPEWSSQTKELMDTLPRAWTRGLLYLLVVFATVVLPWAILAKVDETGSARGRLEPLGTSQRLDAPVAGAVIQVRVKEGQTVKAGQILVELESDVLRTELQGTQTKLEGQVSRLAQLELLKNQLLIAIRTQRQQNQAQQLEKLAQLEQVRQNFEALKAAYSLQKAEKLAQVEQAQQNIHANRAAYKLAEVRLVGSQEKLPRYQNVFEEGAISQDRFLEVQQAVKENKESLTQAQAGIRQAESRLKEQQGNYDKVIYQAQVEIEQAASRLKEQQSSYQSLIQGGKLALLKSEEQFKDLQSQMTALQTEIQESKSQIQSLKFQLAQRVLRAPVSGTIFQLPIQKAGAVVQPSQIVAEIAPQNAPLILRAQMVTSESGSIRQGMPVKLKFDAYPFQDYGIVEGRLSKIAPSSKVTDTNQGQVVTYDLEVTLKQACIPSATHCIALTPGQTATAEVIVRQRRLIDFMLDPFKKLQKGGLEF